MDRVYSELLSWCGAERVRSIKTDVFVKVFAFSAYTTFSTNLIFQLILKTSQGDTCILYGCHVLKRFYNKLFPVMV